MNSRSLTLKYARQLALQGKGEALPLLQRYADSGDTSASVSVAELLAFHGIWEECLQRAGVYLVNPQTVYAGNVFDDMVRLIVYAGHETQEWDFIGRLAIVAKQRLDTNLVSNNLEKQAALFTRYNTILTALQEYAQCRGRSPYEVIDLVSASKLHQAEEKIAYQIAKHNIHSQRPELIKNSVALANHRFALAQYYHQGDEAILMYENNCMPARFDYAVFVAKAYVNKDQLTQAWEVLWANLHRWWPLDPAQVAPLVLLLDTDLARLVSRERRHEVLSVARGPEAKSNR